MWEQTHVFPGTMALIRTGFDLCYAMVKVAPLVFTLFFSEHFSHRVGGVLTITQSSIHQRKDTTVTHVNYLQWYRTFYNTNVTHFVSCHSAPGNHQGNTCKIKVGDICGGSNRMIILRCTGEQAETTFWQFHHALLHSSSSPNWHCWLWSKPRQSYDILKGVFQMISVTERMASKHWQCFKGHAV